MKASRVLLFIILILTALGAICYFFPRQGVKIGNTEINFPSIDEVLVGDTTVKDIKKVAPERDTVELAHLNSLRDTLERFEEAVKEGVGHFYYPNDDASFFDPLFRKLASAKANGEVVRILHYGDSQIEMDRISCDIRRFFQRTFGGGGPGLVPVIQSIPSFAVSQNASGDLVLHTSYGEGARANGNYGLMCKCYQLTGAATFNAVASRHKDTDWRVKRFSTITMLYNDRNGNLSATLSDRNSPYRDTATSTRTGVHAFRWQMDSATASLRISMKGNADIYGIFLDNGPGVAVDNIPLRASSGNQFTLITDTLLKACYREANVGMIILQFGGNSVPVIYNDKSLNNYLTTIERQIRYVKRACPQATILFIGPSDMSKSQGGAMRTYPMLPRLIDSLRSIALRNHAAYWDIYEVMGGENSMVSWVRSGLAGPDYVHFTPAGAHRVGKTLADNFATAYEYYRTRKSITPEQQKKLWNESGQ
ncbi:MAG: hypothetical protein J5741_07465 [Bacteroidales bacterium]|nr:hypothetical protein [Bacteroidales bacterium]